jgi:fibrillarin-like pre-rRNA processing protein
MTEIEQHKYPEVYVAKSKERTTLCMRSLVEHKPVYGEKILKENDGEDRLWSARRSNLSAALTKGLREMPILPGSRVLYLGAASGTTVSHVSDIVGHEGMVYAVEFSPRVARKLVQVASLRPNIVPIVADARHPAEYSHMVGGAIDIVYQDVAQTQQASILVDNLRTFGSFGSWGLIAIKARSIDSTAPLDEIYQKEISLMTERGLEVVENIDLAPLEKDHRFLVTRMAEVPG